MAILKFLADLGTLILRGLRWMKVVVFRQGVREGTAQVKVAKTTEEKTSALLKIRNTVFNRKPPAPPEPPAQ